MYGPVRTVVWQGSVGDRRPYADQHISKLRPDRGFPRCYAAGNAAYPETDAAYLEFEADRLQLARYCNGVILTRERPRHQIDEKGAHEEAVRGLS